MKSLLRVWQECDLKDIEKHLIVAGELSSECFSCHKVGIGLKAQNCPNCGVYFKYMGFKKETSDVLSPKAQRRAFLFSFH